MTIQCLIKDNNLLLQIFNLFIIPVISPRNKNSQLITTAKPISLNFLDKPMSLHFLATHTLTSLICIQLSSKLRTSN